jgi:hypothetical protein
VDDLGAAAGPDSEVVEVGVVVEEDGGDGLGLVLAGLGVDRLDLVADLEGGDRDGLPVREQDPRRRRERLPAQLARLPGIVARAIAGVRGVVVAGVPGVAVAGRPPGLTGVAATAGGIVGRGRTAAPACGVGALAASAAPEPRPATSSPSSPPTAPSSAPSATDSPSPDHEKCPDCAAVIP